MHTSLILHLDVLSSDQKYISLILFDFPLHIQSNLRSHVGHAFNPPTNDINLIYLSLNYIDQMNRFSALLSIEFSIFSRTTHALHL